MVRTHGEPGWPCFSRLAGSTEGLGTHAETLRTLALKALQGGEAKKLVPPSLEEKSTSSPPSLPDEI